jgi:histidinol-phosphate aminotransferase
MFELEKIVRPRILKMKPYSSARDEFSGEASIYLDANENPFGAIPHNQPYNRYPHPLQPDLKAKISTVLGFSPETIFLGNGSDEAIDLLMRVFCEPNQDEIMIAPPTYGMYAVSAEINSIAVREVLLLPDFQLDVKSMLQQIRPNTKIIFICSPNNPTGNLLKIEDIETILRSFAGIVVIDEAYIDFSIADSWAKRLDEFPNLVILRTFSKAWGMAALRIGMAIASPAIIRLFNKVKSPYNLNVLTQNYLWEALDHYEEFKETTSKAIALKNSLSNALSQCPHVQKVYASHANFILVKLVSNASMMYQRLLEKGIVVRDRSKQPLCENCLRISVGTSEEVSEVVNAINRTQ